MAFRTRSARRTPHGALGTHSALRPPPSALFRRLVPAAWRWFALAAVLLTAASVPLRSQADDPTRALSQRADERIRALQAEADQLAIQSRTLLGELRALELQRQIAAERIARMAGELERVAASVEAATSRVAALERQRLAQTAGVEERLVAIYKRGQGGYVRLLLDTANMREVNRLSRGVAALARIDALRIDAHRRLVQTEREALGELDARLAAATELQVQAVEARRALDRALVTRTERLEQLDRRRDLAAEYAGELQKAQEEIARTIGRLGDASALPTLPLTPFRGALDWPLRGRMISGFGRTLTPTGTSLVRNGIEISAPQGTPAAAIHDGQVGFAGPFAGFGVLVILEHGAGAHSLYGHLREASVGLGQQVRQGNVVGEVGMSPTGEEALYFELRIDGRPVDPVQWLRSSP